MTRAPDSARDASRVSPLAGAAPWEAEVQALGEKRNHKATIQVLERYGDALAESDPALAGRAFYEAARVYRNRFYNGAEAARCLERANELMGSAHDFASLLDAPGLGAAAGPPGRLARLATAVGAVYVVPALFLPPEPFPSDTVAGYYRMSALGVVVLIAMYWNLRYWSGFLARLPSLGADIQRRTGASVQVTRHGLTLIGDATPWDHVSLQLRFIGHIITRFLLFGVGLTVVVVLVTWITEGPGGALRFLSGR